MASFLFCLALLQPSTAQVEYRNGPVTVSISRATGRFDISLGETAQIKDCFGEVKLASGETLRTDSFSHHEISKSSVRDSLGPGVQITVTHTGNQSNSTSLTQTFTLYRGRPEVVTRLVLNGIDSGTNQIAPIVSRRPIDFNHRGPLQSLFVPYDNDSYVRYSSSAWDKPDGSCEVGSIYDDVTRRGLVIGSIDHDLWKSAVKFDRGGGLKALSGIADSFTHDKEPHGIVYGARVESPRFVIGLYSDWRAGLERYGDLNAAVQPKLQWRNRIPFGWNSWSGYKEKVNLAAMNGALQFIDKKLPWFRSGGAAYLNFDSFWDNLTRDQRVEYVKRVHAAGLKAGIYWTPFVNWGEPGWKTVGGYQFRDLQLKDSTGALMPKFDGGWPLDPTHPGTLERIDETLKDFVDQGFDYVKLDFLTHGSLEGHHYDPKIQTGTAAYRVGMQRIVDDLSPQKVGRPFFISLSIAPLFPNGYAHSRRISCDVFADLGASEYLMNSHNYGWWEAGRLYQFSDPDSACVYRALGEKPTSEAEGRTRFTASLVAGAMMIEGDALTDPAAEDRVVDVFSNRPLLDLARKSPHFQPVFGDTEDRAGSAYICSEKGGTAYLAVFNFDKSGSKTFDLPLSRLGLSDVTYEAEDMWKHSVNVTPSTIHLELGPADCAVIQLTRRP